MIKVNDQLYESQPLSQKSVEVIVSINGFTHEKTEWLLQNEEFENTSVIPIRELMKKESLGIANKVVLSSVSFLSGMPNDFVVYLIDIQEKFLRPPPLQRVGYALYPEGFYTEESLKARITWLKENKAKLKKPQLLQYLVE